MNRYEVAMSWKSFGKNMAIGVACLMLCLLGGGVVNGQEIEMLGAPAFAVQHEMVTGHLKVKISARSPLDFSSLLQNLDENDSIESAYSKIDRVRNKLYLKEEMIIDIDNIDLDREVRSAIGLKKKIVWVNSSHASGRKWLAANIDSGAACCMVKVTQGKYRHYYQNPNGSWVFGGSTIAGGVWTATTYGSNLFRGFKGVAKGAGTSIADIIMYFYY
jgi:hypothetical protein